MKYGVSLILAVLIIAGCSPENTEEIAIFNEISFALHEGESIADFGDREKDQFHSYFSNTDIQVPLFKYITADDYSVYMGLPFNTSVRDISGFRLLNTPQNQSAVRTDSASYFYINHRSETNYISEFVIDIDENMIYIIAETDSPQLSDSLFNYTALSKRLNQEIND